MSFLKPLTRTTRLSISSQHPPQSCLLRPLSRHAQPHPHRASKRSPPPQPPTPPRRKGIYIASGLFTFCLAAYITNLYTTLSRTPPTTLPQDTDVSSRYNAIAPTFDTSVSLSETLTGITALRKTLARQARGHVLETAAGTGRNSEYYDLRQCRSITFLDPSAAMLAVARGKWQKLHPAFAEKNTVFLTQGAGEPLPAVPKGGFTTIVQTMGVCSTADPAGTLAALGGMLEPGEGRILLLEHGRSWYGWVNWILDRSAGRHAERFGCWYNRDVGRVLEESGLVVERVERRSLGTVWVVEARARGWGEGREGVRNVGGGREERRNGVRV